MRSRTLSRERREALEEPEPSRTPSPAASEVLRLQTGAGNAAVTRLLQRNGLTHEEQLKADWDGADKADQDRFAGGGRPPGTPEQRYYALAPLYKAKGVARPLVWARDNIRDVRFFNQSTPAHRDLITALDAAEDDLKAQGITEQPFKKAWAFNPRTTSKGSWSNHATGKAIDIDELQNPHLTDLRKKKVINAVTGMDVTSGTPGDALGGKSTYEAIVEMSRRFQDRFTPEGLQKRIDELEADEAALAAEEQMLKDELAAIPKRKKGKLTKDERDAAAEHAKHAKALTQAIKDKHKKVEKADERQDLLESERDRYAKAHARFEKQRARIAELVKEIEELEAQIDTLEAQVAADREALKDDDDDKALDKAARKAKATADRALRTKIIKAEKEQKKLKKAQRAKHKAIADIEGDIDELHRWGADGFMNIKPTLFKALKDAGLDWGGEWGATKDFMHFEVPGNAP